MSNLNGDTDKMVEFFDMEEPRRTWFQEFTYQWCKLSSVRLFLWVWNNFVPKSEHNKAITFSNEMTSSMLKQSEQLAELQAKYDKLKIEADDDIDFANKQINEKEKAQIRVIELEQQLGELKSENERLSAQLNGKELKDLESVKEIIRLNVAEARNDERARTIDECIKVCDKELYNASVDKNIRYPSVDLVLERLQELKDETTTADQPKSCEGCVHITTTVGDDFCDSCIDNSRYQPKEK